MKYFIVSESQVYANNFFSSYKFSLSLSRTRCCYGLSMDLLDNIASELGFGYILYIVSDELFGSKQINRKGIFSVPPRELNRTHETIFDQLRDRDKNEKDKNAQRLNKKHHEQSQWNGIVGDLVTGSADMSFAPLSVSK
jgi:glutamate receptor ionotropic, NMDA 3A